MGGEKSFIYLLERREQERADNETFRSIGSTLLCLHFSTLRANERTIIGLFDLILESLAVVARIFG